MWSDFSQLNHSLHPDVARLLLNEFNNTTNGTLPVFDLANTSNDQVCVNNNTMQPEERSVQYLGELSAQIQIPMSMPTPVSLPSPVSLPAMSNWAGDYSFNVSFDSQQDPLPKSVSWIYYKTLNKFYVKMDVPCSINFSTNVVMGKDVFIRAMAVFNRPQDAKEVVTRCLTHSMEELTTQVPEAQHLIRCESALRTYIVDNRTNRHSVCVPFENPPVGQDFSSYLYKFVCFSSCCGGPHRRPMTLIFTLEQGNYVIGRQCFELKICACPFRDRTHDELLHARATKGVEPVAQQTTGLAKKLKLSTKDSQVALPEVSTKKELSKKRKTDLHIKVDDARMYKFLLQMKKLYQMSQKLKNPLLYLVHSSSDEFRSSSDEVRSSSDEDKG